MSNEPKWGSQGTETSPDKGSFIHGETHSPRRRQRKEAQNNEWSPKEILQLIGFFLCILLLLFLVVWGGTALYKYITEKPNKIKIPVSLPPIQTPTIIPSKGYILTIGKAPQDGGSIIREPGRESYLPDTQVTLTAKPDTASGYSFDRWSGDISGTSMITTIKMDSDKNITAYFVDRVVPIISEVQVTDVVDISATVIWATSENTTGYVEYGKTESLGDSVQSTSGRATDHIARLTNLAPSTKYYLRVRSKDQGGNDASPHTATFTTSNAIPIRNEIGKRAPNFTLPSYRDGALDSPNNPDSPNWKETVSLSDLRGKTVVINFWSSYCGACLLEFPIIRDVYQKAELANMNKSPELALITVCIDGRDDRIPKIEDKFRSQVGGFTFPILLDKEDIINKGVLINNDRFNIQVTPTTVFIDEEGIIRYTKIGIFKTIDEVKSILDSL
jgi:thiol-disulfide isomerase/thioredoxin